MIRFRVSRVEFNQACYVAHEYDWGQESKGGFQECVDNTRPRNLQVPLFFFLCGFDLLRVPVALRIGSGLIIISLKYPEWKVDLILEKMGNHS